MKVMQKFGKLLHLFALFITINGKVINQKESESCYYEACTKATLDTFNVHLVPHSHDDVGWLKTVNGYYYEDVQKLIGSVVSALKQNPERRFIQVETAFFKKWWDKQTDERKEIVKELVNNGQFEFTNGAWSMNDEGAVNYQSTIDQFTFALKFLYDTFGKCARPKIGWQIDPFGHSREQASLFAQMGFDGFFFARLDLRDRENRENKAAQDMLWRGSVNLGNTSDIFTSALYKHYSFPSGFCFDIACNDEPFIVDEESPDYNYERRVKEFADYVRTQAKTYPTNNVLMSMGDDVRYVGSFINYINMDRLIKGFELFPQQIDDKQINVFYSTPTCYVKAVNDYVKQNNVKLEMVEDDFFPYAISLNEYFTAYYTSRPTSKRFERLGNNLLQVTKQLAAGSALRSQEENIFHLRDAMGVYQHHDAITGTERQHVADSYNRYLTIGVEKASEAGNTAISYIFNNYQEGVDMEFKSCFLTNVSYCEQSKSDKFTVVIYNPLSRTITHPVYLPVDSKNWKITDQESNNVDYQIMDTIRDFSYIPDFQYSPYNLVFLADDLKPLGLRAYRIEKSDGKKPKPNIKDNIREDTTVGDEDTYIIIDGDTGLLKSVTMNSVSLDIKQEFLYYEGDQGGSNAYIFVPVADKDPVKAYGDRVETTIVEGELFYEVRQEINSYIKQIIKIYRNENNFIEFDWVVGPIDVSDGIPKEIISKFTTPLVTNSTFYTDSNGREIIKRIKNYRSTFEYTNEQPVAGNYYPVTSRIILKDEEKNIEVAVLTDRSEGGSSLNDGELELMVHRYCMGTDSTGEQLQEQQFEQGLVVRGQHYLTLGNIRTDSKSAAAIERDVAQRKLLPPWTFVTTKDLNLEKHETSFLNNPLDDNVQILTLENWNDGTILLRLEHLLELGEDKNLSKEVTVDLTNLFSTFIITELEETTLAGNTPLDENVRLDWPGSTNNLHEIKPLRLKRDVDDLKITLVPMQIRTFVAKVQYNF